jgi:hypothetical protein
MKAVLMSIRPNWLKFIWAGMKTVEVRKTRPTLETPFKAYIYCTGHDGWIIKSPKAGVQKMDSRIIGEFTCDKIDKLVHVGTMMDINILTLDGRYKSSGELLRAACLTEATTKKYLQGRNGYGWHISDLKIYDKPIELDEFSRFGFCGMNGTGVCGNEGCKYYEPSGNYMEPPTCKIDGCSICRPPQSWCYVEELKDV